MKYSKVLPLIFLLMTLNIMAEGLTGKYYNNKTWTNPVQMTRLDSTVNFDWNNGNPGGGITNDNFSVEWTGFIYIPEDATYIFELRHDDDAKLIIDGNTVYSHNTWSSNNFRASSPQNLTKGCYPITTTLIEKSGGAEMMVAWKNDASFSSRQIIATEYLYTSSTCSIEVDVNYRLDECYWLNNSGLPEDVRDSSVNKYHATSSNSASITINNANPTICNYGTFSVKPDLVESEYTNGGDTADSLSVSFWIKADAAFPKWATIVSKTKKYNWNNGWGFVNRGNTSTQLTFFINRYNQNITDTTITAAEGWVHIVGTYDRSVMRLYKNGVEVDTRNYNNPVSNANDAMKLGFDGDSRDGTLIGSLDEVKFWDNTLSAVEIKKIYDNEISGKNYDGTPRVCPTCDANATAGIWGLIGIPADFRTATNKDVADVFDEFSGVDYNKPKNPDNSVNVNGWVLFKRDYNNANNDSSYSVVPYTGLDLEFGQGYWLATNKDVAWSENTLPSVDYNSTNPNCVRSPCVEIDLTSVNLNFGVPDNDPNDHTGRNRNNMLGFAGHTPVNWADSRFLVDGVSYTPSAVEAAGFADKQVWQYNPGPGANANGYTTCDDTTPGGCKLEPYKGFWVILHGITKNKTVKLLIPKE